MQMEWSYVGAVVISGLVIVFFALLLLIIAVSVMGKIFESIKASKNKKPAEVEVKKEAPKPQVQAPAPVAEVSEDDEIVAVIAAAVAAMAEESGTQLKIKSIRRSAPAGSRTNAWARAAANEATRAF